MSAIFEPLRFRNLTVKNRIFRSSTGGRWDNYDGSATQTRINWDLKTAPGGVGAIISSTDKSEPLNGFECERLRIAEIKELAGAFAAAARRAREAGADGAELAGTNGVLFTQFLSSGINDRTDGYGGSLENRARFALEVARAVRAEVGAPRPCTYCNKCLFAFVENPLGCYDESRFDSREEMVEQVLSIYREAA